MPQGEALKEAVAAAGRTGVICAGGGNQSIPDFLQTLYDQIHIGGCRGNATGRNIHQRGLADAVKLCDAIHAVTCLDKTVNEAVKIAA